MAVEMTNPILTQGLFKSKVIKISILVIRTYTFMTQIDWIDLILW